MFEIRHNSRSFLIYKKGPPDNNSLRHLRLPFAGRTASPAQSAEWGSVVERCSPASRGKGGSRSLQSLSYRSGGVITGKSSSNLLAPPCPARGPEAGSLRLF